MIRFIWYPKCTTCQKAKAWLDAHGIEYEERDIRLDKPTRDELAGFYTTSGYELKRFFNTSGLLYKAMELKDKLPSMTDEEKLDLLATDGMLVKRPIIVGDGFVLTGFREKEWEEKIC